MRFKDILDSFYLIQHVNQPTHTSGNTLDFVMTCRDDEAMCSVTVSDMISDHAIVYTKLTVLKPGRPRKKFSYRKYRAIDMNLLRNDILTSDFTSSDTTSLDILVDLYDTSLGNLMDKHAPQQTREFAERPLTPWYNPEINDMKQWRRKCERLYRRTDLTVHNDMYRESRSNLNNLVARSKLTYYRDTIINDCSTQKSLFAFMDKVCHKKQSLLPDGSAEELVTFINDYFVQKITRIRKDLDDQHRIFPLTYLIWTQTRMITISLSSMMCLQNKSRKLSNLPPVLPVLWIPCQHES